MGVRERYLNAQKNRTSTIKEGTKKIGVRERFEQQEERKRLEESINLDTFQDDLISLGSRVETASTNWTDADTMSSLYTDIENMHGRLTDYQAYMGDNASKDVLDLVNAYGNLFDGWDELTNQYGKYKDANQYNDEMEMLDHFNSMSKDDILKWSHNLEAKEAYTTVDGQKILWQDLYDKVDREERVNDPKAKEGLDQFYASKEEDLKKAEEDEMPFWLKGISLIGGDGTGFGTAMNVAMDNKRSDTSYREPQDDWTEEERLIFGSYWDENPEDAYEYATKLNNEKARAEKNAEKQKAGDWSSQNIGTGALSTAGAIVASPLALADFMDDLTDAAAGRPIVEESFLTPFEWSQTVTGANAQALNDWSGVLPENIPVIGGKGVGDLYQVGTSIAQSAVSAYTLGEWGTLVSYFGQGAAQGVDDALSRGATDGQALLYGTVLGLAEGVTEKIGVEKWLKADYSKTLKELLIKQAEAEGLEEGITSLIGNVADNIIMGENSNFNNLVSQYVAQGMSEAEAKQKAWKDSFEGILYDTIVGAVSGGVHMGMSAPIMQYKADVKTGEDIVENRTVDDLKGLAIDVNQEAYQKYIDEINNGNISNRKLGKLYRQVSSEVGDNLETATNDVFTRGVVSILGESQNSYEIADAIRKKANGDKLTTKERQLLQTDEAQSVYSELTLKQDGLKYDLSGIVRDDFKLSRTDSYDKAYNDSKKTDNILREKTANEKAIKDRVAEMKVDEVTEVSATGNSTTIEGIKKDGDNTIVVTSEGEFKVDELTYTKNDAEMIAYTEGMDESMANSFIANYDGKTDLYDYNQSFGIVYTYGETGFASDTVLNNKGVLTEAQASAIYTQAVKDGAVKKQKAIDAITKKYEGRNFVQGTFDDSIIDYKNKTKNGNKVNWKDLNVRQRRAITFAKAFAKATGVNVRFTKSSVGENGKLSGEHGSYISSGNTITIDVYAGLDNISELKDGLKDAIIPTLSHELTHWMKAKAPEMYSKIKEHIGETLAMDGKSLESAINEEMRWIRVEHKDAKLSNDVMREMAINEIIARSCEDMLTSSKKAKEFLSQLTEAEQKTFIRKVQDAFRNIIEWADELLNQYKSSSEEAQIIRKYKERAEQLSKMWDEMLVQAVKSNQSLMTEGITGEQAINNALNEIGLEYDADSETVFSRRSLEEQFNMDNVEEFTKAKEEYVEALMKATKKTKAECERYLNSLFLIHDMIDNDRARLDYEAAVGKSSWVSNTEYGGSIDFSTLCAKRRLFTGTMDAIIDKLPNTVLTDTDFLDIRNRLLAKELQSPCSFCYVEGSRAKNSIYINNWLTEYKKTNPEWIPTLADFTSTTRLEKTRLEHPEAYKAFQDGMNKLAQRKPKEASVRTDYKGEIKVAFADGTSVDIKNKNGGIRFNSFSDFEIIHALDCMQVVTDMATVGLAGQGYTKVKEFAECFGNTGMKINLSLVAKGVDKNGRLIFDEVNGMKYSEANDLRNKFSKNVGTVIVVFNNEQLKAALKDSTIDYVLPFHRSQWRKAQYVLMGLPTDTKDYTMHQNDRIMNPSSKRPVKLSKLKHTATYTNDITGETFEIKDNIMPNQYWDYNADGVTNANRYLDYINSNKLIPKFSFLLSKDANGKWVLPTDKNGNVTDIGKGYFKTLIDFKMYDNDGVGSPQMPVVPDFSMPYINKMLKDYTGGHESFPVAHDVVDDFVKDYKKAHPRKQYSGRRDYAPTFYSQMGKVVDDIKQNKMGADGVVNYLMGKGVKAEEIKWSGIEAFLEGKKSVTKEELQEFVAGSQLQIEEERLSDDAFNKLEDALLDIGMHIADYYDDYLGLETRNLKEYLDEMYQYKELDKETHDRLIKVIDDAQEVSDADRNVRWKRYSLSGGSNYKELIFKLPNSKYTNDAMEAHWNREGVLAHARVQDFTTKDGKKMLFVDEIQSDWHNEGHKKGYVSNVKDAKNQALQKIRNEFAEDSRVSRFAKKGLIDKVFDIIEKEYASNNNRRDNDIDDVVKKELKLLHITEKEYDAMDDAWSKIKKLDKNPATPDAPFSKTYHEYVIKNLLRQAAENDYDSIGWTTGKIQEERWSDKFAEGYRIEYDQDIPKFMNKYGKKWGGKVDTTTLSNGQEVWNFTIPESMKESVLYEGQAMYSSRRDDVNVKNAQEQRDAGDMLNEKAFNKLYSAHKLDVGKRFGNIEEQIESIKKNGFSGGSGAINVLPVGSMKITNFRGINQYNILRKMEEDGKLRKGFADDFKKDLGNSYGEPIFDNVIQKAYAPKKGEYILLVPESGVKSDKVDQGFKPLPYEIVKADYDYQPYYDMYKKAYQKHTSDDIRYSSRRDIDSWLDALSLEGLMDDLRQVEKAPRRVDEVNKRLKQIGLTFNGTKSLAWTDERIDKYLSDSMYAASNPNYAQAYVTYMSPKQFLNLTIGGHTATVDMIENESASYGDLDIEKLGDSKDYRPIYLDIAEGKNSATVVDHNGRHRMYLLGKAGFEKVPILVFSYANKYGKTPKSNYKLTPQVFNRGNFISSARNVVIDEMIPFSQGNRDLIKQKFGPGAKADVQYSSRRDTENISPRTLLADALETVAQNDEEKELLAEYKKNVERLELYQFKADAIKKAINEIGNGTVPAYLEAQREAFKEDLDKLTKKVEYYDRQLLKLEATQPIKKVVDRMVKDRSKYSINRYKESIEKKAKIDGITRKAMALNKSLKANSKDNHIPEAMKPVVANLLNAIDFSSKQLLGMRGGANSGMPTKADISLAQALRDIKDIVTDGKVDGEIVYELYGADMSEDIKSLVKAVDVYANTIGDNAYVLNKMSLEELENFDKLVNAIKTSVSQMNKFHIANSKKGVAYEGQRTSVYLNGLGKAKLHKNKLVTNTIAMLEWGNATPYYAFKRFGESGVLMYEALMDGWDKFAFNVDRIIQYADKAYTSEQVKEWSKELHSFDVLQTGGENKTVQMTTAQIMSLYCLQKREQAKGHISGGGIRITNIETDKGVISQSEGTTLTESNLNEIIGTLTPEQIKVADALQKFMNEDCSAWGNEISMARFGYKAFGEPNYFPIKSDENVTGEEDPKEKEKTLYRLLNMSFTKSVVQNANNRIVVDNIFDVFAQHTSEMAKYNALALPVLDVVRWFNYKEKGKTDKTRFDTLSVKQSMENAYGKEAKNYVNTFLQDINGSDNVGRDRLAKGFFTMSKTASVAFNAKVVALQPTSYLRASAVMEDKYLLKALVQKPNWKMAEEHCGMALWKSLGFYSTDIQRGVAELIKHDETLKDKVTDISMKGAEKADQLTLGILWNACELEVKDKHPDLKVGSEDYYKTVGKRLREIIYATQVVDSTMTRSQMMRSPDTKDKILTAFASEPTLSYNMLQDCYWDWKMTERETGSKTQAFNKHKGKMARVFAAYTVTSAVVAMIETAFQAYRGNDDDDEEEFLDYLKMYFGNFYSNMSIASKIPYIKDILSVIQGFTSSRTDTQWVQNLTKGVKEIFKLFNGKGSTYKAVYNLVQGLSHATGVAGGNLLREIASFWNNTFGEIYPSLKIK